MKKVLTILLLFIYSLAAFGFRVKQIFCCGKLKSITVGVTSSNERECSKGNQHNGCCQSNYRYVKLQDNYIVVEATLAKFKIPTAVHNPAAPVQLSFSKLVKKVVSANFNEPPLHNGVPIFIFNCVYRI